MEVKEHLLVVLVMVGRSYRVTVLRLVIRNSFNYSSLSLVLVYSKLGGRTMLRKELFTQFVGASIVP
jgi:hypothetical protein